MVLVVHGLLEPWGREEVGQGARREDDDHHMEGCTCKAPGQVRGQYEELGRGHPHRMEGRKSPQCLCCVLKLPRLPVASINHITDGDTGGSELGLSHRFQVMTPPPSDVREMKTFRDSVVLRTDPLWAHVSHSTEKHDSQ